MLGSAAILDNDVGFDIINVIQMCYILWGGKYGRYNNNKIK